MPAEITVDAILFDMDGTLVDSTPAVNATYSSFAKKHNFKLDKHPHGVRTRDNCRNWFPDATEDEIADLTVQFEADIVRNAQALEAAGKTGLTVLPGVKRILAEITSHPRAESHYAICTSATLVYASNALKTANIVPPTHFVTADDCTFGKPHPEPYWNGAKMLDIQPTACLVVEDAPAGIASGIAAGAKVLAVCTSHEREELEHLGADYLVEDLSSVRIKWTNNDQIEVLID